VSQRLASTALVSLALVADDPVLRIETDYGDADREAVRTRLEAFIETLAGRKASSSP
jgi:benzoyl-CoA reductase/2-hydroxyglutaryl-CoA dehydratase subunit BcrC/BadD/HgdB